MRKSIRPVRGALVVAEPLEARRLLVAIVSGQTLTGSLAIGQTVEYTFAANAGESIIVALGESVDTAYRPQLEIRAPDGTVLAGTWDFVGLDLEVGNAPQTGTYRALVSDQGFDTAGAFAVTLAKLPGAQANNDGHGGTIQSGQRLAGAISHGDIDVFTFSADAGDSLILGIGKTSQTGSFNPQLDVYGPNGALLSGTWDFVGFDLDLTAPSGGTYYAVVRNLNSSGATGAYRLSFLNLPGAVADDAFDNDGGPILSGQRLAGDIDMAGDLDVFTFSADAGDSLILGIGETFQGGDFRPQLDVYGPNGALLLGTWDFTGFDLDLTAPSGGTYYAVVRTLNSSGATGEYRLSLLNLPGSIADDAFDDDGGTLLSGRRATGDIDLAGDLDVFTFTANAGDSLILGIGEPGDTAFVPQLEVYGPNGALLAGTWNFTGFDLDLTAPSGGTYYAVVRNLNSSGATGDYDLLMVRLPGAQTPDPLDPDGGAIASGQRRLGSISIGDVDVFTFAANAGQTVTLSIAETFDSGDFRPQLTVYGPNGAQVAGTWNFDAFDLDVTAPTSGTYYVAVRDLNGDNPGSYSLALNGTTGPDDADPLVLGTEFRFERRHQVRFTLSEHVTGLSVTDLVLENLTTGQTIDPAVFQADFLSLGNVAVFSFPALSAGALPDGNYRATLPAAAVQDNAGNPLGADGTFDFFVLAGDANRNRSVNLADFGIVRANFGRSGRTFSQGDFNYDGTVNLADFGILRARFGTFLPPEGGDLFGGGGNDSGDDEDLA